MSDLKIVITGDAKSVQAAFAAITSGAEKMGVTVERAGQEAGQSLTRFEETATQSAAATGASFERIGSAIGKAGLAFGGFSLIADRAAADSAASLVQVQTAFQGAGLAIEDYQGRINELGKTAVHLGFDDEDAQNSLAQILTITKDVTKSFNDVRLAEDIARGSGKSLAEATNLVAAAESGRTRGLVQLVGNLGSTATAQDYLASAQQKYAGAADNYANTQAGAFDRMKVQISNDLEAAGAAMSRFQMPILALSSAATALGPLAGTIKEIANAEKTAELGGAALDLALGPVGLAAAALAAGAGIVYLAMHTREYVSASEAAAAATTDLSHLLTVLASQSAPKDATIITSLRDQLTGLITDAGQRQDVLQKLTDLSNYTLDRTVLDSVANAIDLTQEGAYRSIEAVSGLTQAEVDYFDANKDGVLTINELNAALAQYQGNLDRLNSDQAKQVSKDLDTLFTLPNVDFSKLNAALSGLATQFQSGQLTGDQFTAALDGMVHNFEPYITSAEDAAKANANLAASSGTATAAIKDTQAAIQAQIIMYGASGSVVASYAESQRDSVAITKDSTKATIDDTAARAANGQAIAAQMAQYAGVNRSLGQAITQAQALAKLTEDAGHRIALSGASDALGKINKATSDAVLSTDQFTEAMKREADVASSSHGSSFLPNAQDFEASSAAMKAQLGVYYDLTKGIESASDAQAQFKSVQDGLLGQEGVYSQQQSEYTGQVNAITAAHDLLNQKVQEGLPLTKQEQEFQDNYNAALERGQGAVDDATISQGLLAEQYLLNMQKGDELNRSLDGQTGAVGDLVTTIQELILSLSGVPDEVRTSILLDMSQADPKNLDLYIQYLNSIPSSVSTVIESVYVSSGSSSTGGAGGAGKGNSGLSNALGGLVGYANGGIVRAELAEHGPELVHLANGGVALASDRGTYNVPRGSYVDTAPATRSLMSMGEPNVNININGVGKSTEEILRELVPAIVAATKRHYSGHGVRG